jgi:(p)ppGpp synthase/HD superfamily hydrolase
MSQWLAAAERLGFTDKATMMAAVGAGELTVLELVDALFAGAPVERQLSLIPGAEKASGRGCRLVVEAPDREGLLLDIASLLRERRIPLLANTGGIDRETGRAVISLEISFPGMSELAVVLGRLQNVEGVTAARRVPL